MAKSGASRLRPVQVYLEERQHRALKEIARRRRVPVARLIRAGAEHVIREALPPDQDPLADLAALAVSGGPADGAARHDAYLTGTARARRPRR
jgi:hypothetical protein